MMTKGACFKTHMPMICGTNGQACARWLAVHARLWVTHSAATGPSPHGLDFALRCLVGRQARSEDVRGEGVGVAAAVHKAARSCCTQCDTRALYRGLGFRWSEKVGSGEAGRDGEGGSQNTPEQLNGDFEGSSVPL